MNHPSSPGIKSAERTIDVLGLLADHVSGLTLREIGSELGLPKSSAFGLMCTLVERKVVRLSQRDGLSVYRLGHRVFEIGQAFMQTTDLLGDGLHVVKELSISTGETAHLAVLDGYEVVYLAKHESIHPIRMVSIVGRRLSAHSCGVGKALLAGLSDAEVISRFGDPGAMQALTKSTLTDVDALLADIKQVRERGYSIEREESSVGIACVAAPVYDTTGVVAATSLSIPVGRFSQSSEHEVAQRVLKAATTLSERLGVNFYPEKITPVLTVSNTIGSPQ